MTLDDLKRFVSVGEGRHTEFKRRMPQPERLAREVIAFANADGGRLFLGVSDEGEIVGLRDVFEEEYGLVEALSRHVEPRIETYIERVPITPKREVLVVEVPSSAHKPHFLISANGNGETRSAFVRVGASSVAASREAVRLMRFERNPRDVRFEFGEKERVLMRYLDRHERITVDQFARLAAIPRRQASQTLVLLAKADLLRLHPDEAEDYFTLGYDSTR